MPTSKRPSRFTWFSQNSDSPISDSREEVENISEFIPVGRLVHDQSEERIRRESQAIATMLFGKELGSFPVHGRKALAYGVVTDELAKADIEDASVVALQPGWSYQVASNIDAHYFVVETRALYSGPWLGTLAPGGEHLFEELRALIVEAQRNRVTPLLIDNASPESSSPLSFSMVSPLTQLRAAIPASIENLFDSADPFMPRPSPLLERLFSYSQQTSPRNSHSW